MASRLAGAGCSLSCVQLCSLLDLTLGHGTALTLSIISFGDEIVWRIAETDPSEWSLRPLVDATIRNPRQCVRGWCEPSVAFLDDGDLVVSNRTLLLESSALPEDAAALFEPLSGLVAALRHVSGQFRLPSVSQVVSQIPSYTGPVIDAWPRAIVRGWVTPSLVLQAARFALLPNAIEVAVRGGPPHWSVFFLDALRAHSAGDWKIAFVLAAFAVETGIGEALSEWHSSKLGATPRAPGVVERPDGTRADPVYDLMGERTSFRLSLHQRPLHLAGRSLLLEDKATYEALLRLYTTRNKIAHLGSPDPVDGSFALVREDVETAIDVAARGLAFFGKAVSRRPATGPMIEVSFPDFELEAAPDATDAPPSAKA